MANQTHPAQPDAPAAEQHVQQNGSLEDHSSAHKQRTNHSNDAAAPSPVPTAPQEQPAREEQHVVTPLMSATGPKSILSRPQEVSKGETDNLGDAESQPSVSRPSNDARQSGAEATTSQASKSQTFQARRTLISLVYPANKAFTSYCNFVPSITADLS